MEKNLQNQENQQTDTLAWWKSWQRVDDASCLKRISGGNLNGKTDINPVWRMRKLTELFGPVGFGWNVREVERWTSEAAGEIGAFVKVELRICLGGKWSEPIEGTGGSKLCGKGRGEGLNDEAWKMATTDAISVACKSLGMAADVYTGRQSHNNNDGPDFGTKYEPRNYAPQGPRNAQPGNYTGGGSYGRQRAQNAAPAQSYQQAPPPAPAPQYQTGPVTVPSQPAGKTHIVLATVTTGRCRSIIAAQARHDFDAPADWKAGLDAILAKYDVDQDALREIEARAVAQRQETQQAQVNNLNL